MLNLTNPGINIVDNTAAIDFKRSNDILNAVNTYRYGLNVPLLEPTKDELVQSIKAFETSSKAFSGASASTGNALTATNQVADLYYSDIEGGAFIKSGIDYKTNIFSSITLPSLTINGTFVAQVGGTASTNEISAFARKDVSLQGYNAIIQGFEDTLVRCTDPAELIATFEQALDNQKLIFSDTLVANAITSTTSGVIALDPTQVATVGSIHLNMYKQIGLIGKYITSGRAKFYMTHAAYIRLRSEQDSQGRFLDCSCSLVNASAGALPLSGAVGYFEGYEIILVGGDASTGRGLLDAYVTSTSGVVTANTGGTKSIVIFAAPQAIVVIRGRAEYDVIRVFSAETDRSSFLDGQTTIGARTYMAAALRNPLRVSYFSI